MTLSAILLSLLYSDIFSLAMLQCDKQILIDPINS